MTPVSVASTHSYEEKAPLRVSSQCECASQGRPEDAITGLVNESRRYAAAVQPMPRLRPDISKPLRLFMISDIVALHLAFVIAWALAFVVNVFVMGRTEGVSLADMDGWRWGQLGLIAGAVILWFEHAGHYNVRVPAWMEAQKIFGTLGLAMLVDGFLLFAEKQDFSRLWLMSGWVFAAGLMVALRAACRGILRSRHAWQVPTLLIGNGKTANDAKQAIEAEPSLGYKVKAQIADVEQAFGNVGETWETLCARHGADYIVVALEGSQLAQAELSLAQLMRENVPFSVLSPLRRVPVTGTTAPHYFFNHDVMMITHAQR